MESRLIFLAVVLVGVGCSTKQRASVGETQREVRLTEDRSRLEKLRKDVPEEDKTYNDESALILNLFTDDTKTPYQINSKFNEIANRKREEFSKNERKVRETYTRDEKKRREDFLNTLKNARNEKKITKLSQQDRNQFFNEQDTERRRFFADESDARRNLDSRLRQERQDFEVHMRDVRSRFDGEMKTYTKAFQEKQKLSNQKQSSGQPSKVKPPPGFTENDLRDLESIPQSGKPIEPSSGESQ